MGMSGSKPHRLSNFVFEQQRPGIGQHCFCPVKLEFNDGQDLALTQAMADCVLVLRGSLLKTVRDHTLWPPLKGARLASGINSGVEVCMLRVLSCLAAPSIRAASWNWVIAAGLMASVPAAGQNTGSAPAAPARSFSQDQIRQLIQQVADKDSENDKKQRDYTYMERQEERKLDGKGEVKSTEVKTFEVMELYGEQVERLIAKDDKPLPDRDARKEEEKIRKLMDKRKNESEQERTKRREKEEKEREKGRQFIHEVAEAYNFRLAGIERLDGRETYLIDAKPRPGYQPHLSEARILPKFRFRVWIDEGELEWKKLDIQCIDTVSFGLFLARVHKGSRIVIEQARVNDEVWLPRHVHVRVDARLALVKGFNLEEDFTYRDYKRFRTESRIVLGAEAP